MNRHYVYQHIDPYTKEVVYVGCGVDGRAFVIESRSLDHKAWIESILQDYGMLDYVEILGQQLTKKQALKLERMVSERLKPRFNVRIRPEESFKDSDNTAANNARRRYAQQAAERVYSKVRACLDEAGSAHQAAHLLNQRGVPALRGGHWSCGQVLRILRRVKAASES